MARGCDIKDTASLACHASAQPQLCLATGGGICASCCADGTQEKARADALVDGPRSAFFRKRWRNRRSPPTWRHLLRHPRRSDQTAWLRMQSEAKRSPGNGSPCNLRFAGRFSEIAGRADPLPVKFPNGFKMLEGVLPT